MEERLKSKIDQFERLEESHQRLKEEFHKLFEEKKRLLEEVNKLRNDNNEVFCLLKALLSPQFFLKKIYEKHVWLINQPFFLFVCCLA